MENQNTTDYYTLSEIFVTLREAYQEVQSILNRMNEIVDVKSNVPYTKEVNLTLKTIKKDDIKEPSVGLVVSKDPKSTIGTRIRKKLDYFGYNELRHNLDHAIYNLVGEDNNYQFKQRMYDYLYYPYQPEVSISWFNQKEFTELYNKLKNTDLYKLRDLCIEVNPFQTLFVFGDFVDLTSEGEYGKGISISYDATDDKIHLSSSKRYSTGFVEQLLLTKIPKYLLPYEYQELIDANTSQLTCSYIDDIIGKRKETLSFSENQRVLKKEINRKKRTDK